MNYKRSTVASLLRRLRQYGGYVGCGCSRQLPEEAADKCSQQLNCARADYMRAVAALSRLVRQKEAA